MTAQKIKNMVKAISDNNCGVVYNDSGNGCAGPGYADSQCLQDMLDAGDFDAAEIEQLDADLMATSFKTAEVTLDSNTRWMQVRFAQADDYSQVCWIWEV